MNSRPSTSAGAEFEPVLARSGAVVVGAVGVVEVLVVGQALMLPTYSTGDMVWVP